MKRDIVYGDIKFSADFSVEDWNSLVKLKFGKYFINEGVLEKNKELLRTEIINFIKFSEKPEYFKLFEWQYSLTEDCLKIDRSQTINIIASSFNEISNTDTKWMTNVLTQPDIASFLERDKVSYLFKVIDETLEGVFKPRFKLLDKFTRLKANQSIVDNSNFDFGKLIKDFPVQFAIDASLFLMDPLFLISTNQWRNIAAHKSFKISKNQVTVFYGKYNIQSVDITFQDFYKIVSWTQDIYRVIRLAQVLIDLNYIKEIVNEIGGVQNINIRLESSLTHLIHNMQVVGFKFVSTEEQNDTFCITFEGKKGFELQPSLIHASQCLVKLSCAIFDDKFEKDNFKNAKVCVIEKSSKMIGCATVPIEIALEMVYGKIDQEKYLGNIEFEIIDSI